MYFVSIIFTKYINTLTNYNVKAILGMLQSVASISEGHLLKSKGSVQRWLSSRFHSEWTLRFIPEGCKVPQSGNIHMHEHTHQCMSMHEAHAFLMKAIREPKRRRCAEMSTLMYTFSHTSVYVHAWSTRVPDEGHYRAETSTVCWDVPH